MFEQYIENRRQRSIESAAPYLEPGESIVASAVTEAGIPGAVTGGIAGGGGFLAIAGFAGGLGAAVGAFGLLIALGAIAASFLSTRQHFVAATQRNLYVFRSPPLKPSRVGGVDEKHPLASAGLSRSPQGLVVAGRERRVTPPFAKQADHLTAAVAHGGQPPAQPGWYEDPWRQARLRYFDGSWTSHTAQ